MSKKGRYAAVPRITMQIGAFTDYFESLNPAFHFIVDTQGHPQENGIDEGWYYDPINGVFSLEGEPPIIETPAALNEVQVLSRQVENLRQATQERLADLETVLAQSNDALRQDGADALMAELLQRGLLI